MPNIASFIVYVIVTSITPGPNNIMSMSNASKYGFKKGLPFNFGVLFGFLGVLVCCTLFSSLLYNAIPKIEPIMRYFGAAYILWLAWSIFNEHKKEGKKSLETNNILTGAVLQFVNVKVIIYRPSVTLNA
jgi:threonine/homoserine/homoserine lactone efflux protein